MKRISMLLVTLGTLCGSCSHRPKGVASQQSVSPRHTIFPSQQPVPSSIIASLPRRIAALPEGRSISISRLVERLGLSAYRSNVSVNLRWNTFFMFLDADHILYFNMDHNTLQEGMFLQTPWNAKVLECSLRRNPDVTVISKKLAGP